MFQLQKLIKLTFYLHFLLQKNIEMLQDTFKKSQDQGLFITSSGFWDWKRVPNPGISGCNPYG